MIKSIYLAIIITCLSFYSCKKENTKTITPVKIEFKHEGNLQITDTSGIVKKELQIEIADNTYEHQTGLMYRKKMKKNNGMLFVFDAALMRSFYMKNTYIPLDLIYIDTDNTIINIIKNAAPLNEQSLPSEAPAKYVLEINGGLSDAWNIQPGDKIKYTNLN